MSSENARAVDFATEAPVRGDLDVRWIHGSPRRKPNNDPPIQVHRYDPHSYVLRQSKALNPEAPFLYLLFGNERAVLFEPGVVKRPPVHPFGGSVEGASVGCRADPPGVIYGLVAPPPPSPP